MVRKIIIGIGVLAALFLLYNIVLLYLGYKDLANVPPDQVLGNPNGDLSVVEFLDYRCIYCKDVHPTITEAVRRDGKIRYIIRPLVFLDEQSLEASKALYAAANQGQFALMHEKLIAHQGDFDEDSLEDIAQSAGLNEDQFEADMSSDEIFKPLRENYTIFAKIGGNATPTFVVGHRLQYVPEGRMPTVEDFLNMFEQARKAGLE